MSIQTGAMRTNRHVALIAAVSNVSIQYNFSVIAIALAFMDNRPSSPDPAYPRTDAQSSLLKSLVFAGAILGQLTMGYAGDALGRRKAMLLTNALSVVGALGSALFTWGPPGTLYTILGGCRFLLGVGVGGKYPLAATMSREADQLAAKQNPSITVAKGFFWQTPGTVLPYVVALVLLSVVGKTSYGAAYMSTTSLEFRLLLGLGAIPTSIVMLLTYHTSDSREYLASRSADTRSPLQVVRKHPELLRHLAGCGLSWALYDFVYYGTSFNQVLITNAVFGSDDALFDNCWQNIVLTAMGLPGVVLAILALYRWSSRKLQILGFVLMGCTSAGLALAVLLDASEATKFGCFCAILFSMNWGPNVSTYTLPAEVFPTAVRSTCFGLCAGMGKVGAIIGSASFQAITDAVGIDGVYLVCAAVSLLGLLVTLALVPTPQSLEHERPSDAAPMIAPATGGLEADATAASRCECLLPSGSQDGGSGQR